MLKLKKVCKGVIFFSYYNIRNHVIFKAKECDNTHSSLNDSDQSKLYLPRDMHFKFLNIFHSVIVSLTSKTEACENVTLSTVLYCTCVNLVFHIKGRTQVGLRAECSVQATWVLVLSSSVTPVGNRGRFLLTVIRRS
jgi:hypothetical protein